jgi:hypothetical protein
VAVIGAKAQQPDGMIFNNTNSDGVILDGYDPVAFFTDNKPVKGDATFQFTYDKAIYHFVSRYLDLFKGSENTNHNLSGCAVVCWVAWHRDVNTFYRQWPLVVQHNQGR